MEPPSYGYWRAYVPPRAWNRSSRCSSWLLMRRRYSWNSTIAARPRAVRRPVLVQNATMPSEDQLPEDLRPLTRRNAIDLRSNDWTVGVGSLIRFLQNLIGR